MLLFDWVTAEARVGAFNKVFVGTGNACKTALGSLTACFSLDWSLFIAISCGWPMGAVGVSAAADVLRKSVREGALLITAGAIVLGVPDWWATGYSGGGRVLLATSVSADIPGARAMGRRGSGSLSSLNRFLLEVRTGSILAISWMGALTDGVLVMPGALAIAKGASEAIVLIEPPLGTDVTGAEPTAFLLISVPTDVVANFGALTV